jgi:hypothetical protein
LSQEDPDVLLVSLPLAGHEERNDALEALGTEEHLLPKRFWELLPR